MFEKKARAAGMEEAGSVAEEMVVAGAREAVVREVVVREAVVRVTVVRAVAATAKAAVVLRESVVSETVAASGLQAQHTHHTCGRISILLSSVHNALP